jgi:putative iron-only hydrogenase system regulator
MEKRIAIMGIIVENRDNIMELNELLHEHGESVIGRMGIPFREERLNVISVVLCAPQEEIDELAEKVEKIPGVNVKVTNSTKVVSE